MLLFPREVVTALIRPDFSCLAWTKVTWAMVDVDKGVVHPDTFGLASHKYRWLSTAEITAEALAAKEAILAWRRWTRLALGVGPDEKGKIIGDTPFFYMRPNGSRPMSERWLQAIRTSPCPFDVLMRITEQFMVDRSVMADRTSWERARERLFRGTFDPETVVTLDFTGTEPATAAPPKPKAEPMAGLKQSGRRAGIADPFPLPERLRPAWARVEATYAYATMAGYRSRLRILFSYIGDELPTSTAEVRTMAQRIEDERGTPRKGHVITAWNTLVEAAKADGLELPRG